MKTGLKALGLIVGVLAAILVGCSSTSPLDLSLNPPTQSLFVFEIERSARLLNAFDSALESRCGYTTEPWETMLNDNPEEAKKVLPMAEDIHALIVRMDELDAEIDATGVVPAGFNVFRDKLPDGAYNKVAHLYAEIARTYTAYVLVLKEALDGDCIDVDAVGVDN